MICFKYNKETYFSLVYPEFRVNSLSFIPAVAVKDIKYFWFSILFGVVSIISIIYISCENSTYFSDELGDFLSAFYLFYINIHMFYLYYNFNKISIYCKIDIIKVSYVVLLSICVFFISMIISLISLIFLLHGHIVYFMLFLLTILLSILIMMAINYFKIYKRKLK